MKIRLIAVLYTILILICGVFLWNKIESGKSYSIDMLDLNTKRDETEEKTENIRYIRRERYSGTASRTFRVNEYVTQEDISAKHENGILTIRVAKIDKEKREAENKKLISIEG